MATFGTPNEAKDNVIGPAIYASGLSCGLYTNTANSLSAASVLADITEPSGTGYTRVNLNGTWAYNNGVVTHTPNATFENTGGSSWTGDITGAFITDGVYLIHFLDYSAGATTMTAGKVIDVDISSLVS
jgi:hypothetical protein